LQKGVGLPAQGHVRYFEARCVFEESAVFELQQIGAVLGEHFLPKMVSAHRLREVRLQRGNEVLVEEDLKPLSVAVLLREQKIELEPIIILLKR
jgi:hypothetical protein